MPKRYQGWMSWDEASHHSIRLYDLLHQKFISSHDDILVNESKYWRTLKRGKKSFAAINPTNKGLRIFLSCQHTEINNPKALVRRSSSTGVWGEKYPSQMDFNQEELVEHVCNLLQQAYMKTAP
jgi:predicted transport protein